MGSRPNVYNPDPQRSTETVAGFNIYSPQYLQWTVLSSKVRIETVNNNDTMTTLVVRPFRAAIPFSNTPNTLDNQMEQPGVYKRSIGSRYGGPNKLVTKYYATTARQENVSPSFVKDDPTFSGFGTTPPTELWYWNIGWAPMNAGQALDFGFQLKVTYYVIWRLRAEQLS